MIYSKDQAFELIERSLNMPLSAEQRAILADEGGHPVLVNASAGSGKTTTLMLAIIYKYLTGQINDVREILGVTFSKNAQLNMEERFDTYAFAIVNEGVLAGDYSERLYKLLISKPDFRTFHGLFYALLRAIPKYKSYKVLANHYELADLMYPAMRNFNQDGDVSRSDYLNGIFDQRNFITNQNLSLSGLLTPELVDKLTQKFGFARPEPWIEDYNDVIRKYNELKIRLKAIDFDDMKVLLIKETNTDKFRNFVRPELSHITYAFIDEFQDIDTAQAGLLAHILPSKAFKQLVAIGDDDQSIYRFRGSNPNIILNFSKTFPNAITYTLATNYRTGGNILPLAKSLISHNVRRLDKELKTGRSNIGEYVITDDWTTVRDDILKHSGENVAVLTRRNIEGQLMADDLALRAGFKVEQQAGVPKMDDTPIYMNYRDLFFAFWENDVNLFKKASKIIGFSSYAIHVDAVMVVDDDITDLRSYIKQAPTHYRDFTQGFKLHRNKEFDARVGETFEHIQLLKRQYELKDEPFKAEQLVKAIYDLTDKYRKFMLKRGLWQNSTLTNSINHLKARLEINHTYDAYTQDVETITHNLTDVNPDVVIMTLHKSKGLEFDHVYILGEDANVYDETLNETYKLFEGVYDKRSLVDRLKHAYKTGSHTKYIDVTLGFQESNTASTFAMPVDKIMIEYEIDDWLAGERHTLSAPVADLLNQMLSLSLIVTNHVEEERRLFYVGITRARERLTIYKAPEPSYFFNELNDEL
jgi:Superfamily I DNA and RNA helicases